MIALKMEEWQSLVDKLTQLTRADMGRGACPCPACQGLRGRIHWEVDALESLWITFDESSVSIAKDDESEEVTIEIRNCRGESVTSLSTGDVPDMLSSSIKRLYELADEKRNDTYKSLMESLDKLWMLPRLSVRPPRR